ncbi:hypothetical protein [Leuconostoc mesenteroides]|uniref:hypothetical protein n=1 Tax=Leuconostoc mesenteroides TaxID=1245 RepID=UPI001E4D5B56|nr:hypothetical protein [Leuconostoc mesenteroides]USI45510.1 hypothetical protein M0D19_08420 [Leuconostoc mesenteroides]
MKTNKDKMIDFLHDHPESNADDLIQGLKLSKSEIMGLANLLAEEKITISPFMQGKISLSTKGKIYYDEHHIAKRTSFWKEIRDKLMWPTITLIIGYLIGRFL